MNMGVQEICNKLRLPKLISDGMVLQRDAVIKLWGFAAAGENISVDFLDKTYNTVANDEGKWEIQLSNLKAGGPFSMKIIGENETICLRDILIGDVWVCSGQSNMELPIQRVKDFYYDEVINACNPKIREFKVNLTYNFCEPQADVEIGSWRAVNSDTILAFSATGYFFAEDLYKKYGVPIGLINSSIGGSPVEAWLSEEALKSFPKYMEAAIKFRDDKLIEKILSDDQEKTQRWYAELDKNDMGLENKSIPWYDYNYNDSTWVTTKIPVNFNEIGLHNFKGVIWLRREMYLPSELKGKKARLWLGRIVDSDTAYVNGVEVGGTGYQYPPRKYEVPEGVLKEGKNIITVRVTCNNGNGEFIDDKPYNLYIEDKTIDLKGEWKYKIGVEALKPLPFSTFIQWNPLGLYNGMIAPLINYAIKGVIWYQGESNITRAFEYTSLFSALIKDWRQKWGQGDFPFLYVQLPNYYEPVDEGGKEGWSELREAQLNTLALPNVGMAVAIDLGEWNDLHPLNKKDVGKRLSLLAQKLAYGEDIVYQGPLFESMRIEDNKIILKFSNIGGGLIAKGGGKLEGFQISGEDNKFLWAEATIQGDEVVVWNEKILNPIAVRYAWMDNPQTSNLYNKEGLPASPFRVKKQ